MTVTLNELMEKLSSQVDEVTILEVLDLRTHQILEAFPDLVEEKQEELYLLLNLEEDYE